MRSMPKSLAAALILALLLVQAGAQRPAFAADPAPKADQDDDEYVTFTKEHPLGEAKPGQALLYVVRPTSIGFAIKSFFFVDDAIRGINRGSSYFFVDVPPGKHVLWSKSENVDALELQFEAGKTYYVQQKVQPGWGRARTRLELLSDAEGKEALAKCSKHGVMQAAGVTKGNEYAATLKANVQEDLDRKAKEAAQVKDKKE